MQIQKKFLILIIILACFVAYFNTLFAHFVWDDGPLIEGNPYIKSIKFLPLFFTKDIWDIGVQNMTSGYYRPLLALSFMLDYQLWKLNPLGYHLTNLILHALICVLIFIFVQKLFREQVIAFLAAILFAVHPVHTESVSFICARVDLICLVFMLLSLIWFFQYHSNKKIIFYILSLFSFFAALLTKEMAVIFPFLVIAMDYFCINKQKIRNLIKNSWLLHSGIFLIMAAYLLLRYIFVGWEFLSLKGLSYSNFTYGTSSLWRCFTVLKIFSYYVRLLFFPYNLNADYVFPPANSFFELPVIIGFALAVLSIYLVLKNAKKNTLLSFAIVWFFITYFPVSNIISSGNIFAERYIYIPSIGFCMAVGFCFLKLSQLKIKTKTLNWQRSVFLLFTLIILLFTRTTIERNMVWRNEFTLWYDTLRVSPKSGRARLNLGNVYYKINYLDEAIQEFNAVLHSQIDPRWYNYVFNNSGLVYMKKGMIDEAIKAFNIAISLDPETAMTYNNLSAAYGRKKDYQKSIQVALTALRKNPYFYAAHFNLATSYKQLGMNKEAISEYNEYLAVVPYDFNTRVELGRVYYKSGDIKKAREEWSKVLELSRDNQAARDALKLLENK